jgi:ribosomal protein S1
VSATVESVESDKFWVSVDGVPKLKLLKELSVGETLDGFVAIKRKTGGILLDVGAEKLASVLAPKSEWNKLKLRQDVVTTIEKVDGDSVWVSVDGLTKSRLSSDLKVGEKLEGRVVRKRSDAVLVDVGCERIAKVFAPRKVALKKLEPNQNVTVTVERVEARSIMVSVKGVPKPRRFLSDLKAGDTLNGKVAYKSRDGVFVDIGGEDEARVFAPKLQALNTLEQGQTVKATVEEMDSVSTWVSVEGLPKMKKIEDLKEGQVIEGVVFNRSQHGVYLDIGSMAMARVLAPRDDALDKLKYQDAVSATIVKIRSNYILASVPGLPTLKLLEDFQEGQLVDGFVAQRNAGGVLVDFGCERLGLLSASRGDVFKLESLERLEGLRIETVDFKEGRIDLSLAGLEDLVAGRAERPPSRAAKEKESAEGKKPRRPRRKRSGGAGAPTAGKD